uniref:Transposase Tc1-like domain-containing protein n=1 Tax=Bactrocera latifrons TaxID=174628 RepID=A0A0K8WHZ5_BACLA
MYSQNERVNCIVLSKGEIVNVKKMVFGAIHLYKKTKKFETPIRKSRPRKTTPPEDRIICRTSKNHPFMTSRKIKAEVGQEVNVEISARTIRRRLQESGLRVCLAAKKNRL